MICPKCKIENKDNFCIKCGYMINDNKEVQIHYEDLGEKERQTQKLKKYIGDDNDRILNKVFNIKALIFGPFYYIYRKCYLIGYVFLFIFIALISFLLKFDQRILLIFLFLNSLFHYCFFNAIYIEICKKEIKKIKNIKEKGTSIIAPFLSILLITIIFAIIYIINQ